MRSRTPGSALAVAGLLAGIALTTAAPAQATDAAHCRPGYSRGSGGGEPCPRRCPTSPTAIPTSTPTTGPPTRPTPGPPVSSPPADLPMTPPSIQSVEPDPADTGTVTDTVAALRDHADCAPPCPTYPVSPPPTTRPTTRPTSRPPTTQPTPPFNPSRTPVPPGLPMIPPPIVSVPDGPDGADVLTRLGGRRQPRPTCAPTTPATVLPHPGDSTAPAATEPPVTAPTSPPVGGGGGAAGDVGGTGTLVLTGSATSLVAGIAATLIVAGAALVVALRRRRSTRFVA